MNSYVNQYKKNEIETATPEKILILLYDGAIKFLVQAKESINKKDISETHKNLIAAQNIILEFMQAIDMENGGDLAQRLYRLYEYFYNTLVEANMKQDMKKVNEVLEHLKSLRDTWRKAINIANAEKMQNNSLIDDENEDSYEEDESEEE